MVFMGENFLSLAPYKIILNKFDFAILCSYHSCGGNVELNAVSNIGYNSLYVFLFDTIFFKSDVCNGIIFIPFTDLE